MRMTTEEKENRKFGLIVGAAFLLIGLIRSYKTGHINYTLPCSGIALILCGLLFKARLTPLRILWEKVGNVLGYINSLIILTVIYFVIVSPIGILKRVLKKDALKLKWHKGSETYWQTVLHETETDLNRQF